MRFIGSHQIIKTEESSNWLEAERRLEQETGAEPGLNPSIGNSSTQLNIADSPEQSVTRETRVTPQDIHALLLLVIGLIFLMISGCELDNRSAVQPKEIAPTKAQPKAVNQFKSYWKLSENGIKWSVNSPHHDQLEMSGLQVSAVIDYGLSTEGALILEKTLVWPMLRTLPNDTHASLIRKFSNQLMPNIYIDGKQIQAPALKEVIFDGQLTLIQMLSPAVKLSRTLSVHPSEPAFIERWQFDNNSEKLLELRLTEVNDSEVTPSDQGEYGSYQISVNSDELTTSLQPFDGEEHFIVYSAKLVDEMLYIEPASAINQRADQVEAWRNALKLETPDAKINQMFEFAKIRATESIFATRGGLAHAPGGTRYYAAIWANDQAEYVNPFFPYLGDRRGIESAINSFSWFARYMNSEYKPLPSSIIAEGKDIWDGAGDRGDCAMIAYGASDFSLSLGDKNVARQLLPLIDWCLEYNRRQRLESGVIASDSDELEGRFPAGKANLSTNILAYGGLIRAARVKAALGEPSDKLLEEAASLKSAIIEYFSAEVSGFQTYRYFDGNSKLRSWIALPLAFGIDANKQGTIDALLSEKLWTIDGLLTEEGDTTFWDRSTLYGFRALMKVGELERVWPYFEHYSYKRLTGEHVPYAVEAWPEGEQRHLSAESGLYARVIVEGLFGIEPIGFNEFLLAPRLPAHWDSMSLREIYAFNGPFDVEINRNGKTLSVSILIQGNVVQSFDWDGSSPITVKL
ncbi:hypothetical protein [Shewanella sp. UCD-KL12]|uniref:hypothetical protein n=1 Tax=Shewanella sp. UCD-KL12 TaxID=1917163 RepID=UPI0009FB3DC8|nr:hypothetical protein [Shewanella sp. UCD-KL12]